MFGWGGCAHGCEEGFGVAEGDAQAGAPQEAAVLKEDASKAVAKPQTQAEVSGCGIGVQEGTIPDSHLLLSSNPTNSSFSKLSPRPVYARSVMRMKSLS